MVTRTRLSVTFTRTLPVFFKHKNTFCDLSPTNRTQQHYGKHICSFKSPPSLWLHVSLWSSHSSNNSPASLELNSTSATFLATWISVCVLYRHDWNISLSFCKNGMYHVNTNLPLTEKRRVLPLTPTMTRRTQLTLGNLGVRSKSRTYSYCEFSRWTLKLAVWIFIAVRIFQIVYMMLRISNVFLWMKYVFEINALLSLYWNIIQ